MHYDSIPSLTTVVATKIDEAIVGLPDDDALAYLTELRTELSAVLKQKRRDVRDHQRGVTRRGRGKREAIETYMMTHRNDATMDEVAEHFGVSVPYVHQIRDAMNHYHRLRRPHLGSLFPHKLALLKARRLGTTVNGSPAWPDDGYRDPETVARENELDLAEHGRAVATWPWVYGWQNTTVMETFWLPAKSDDVIRAALAFFDAEMERLLREGDRDTNYAYGCGPWASSLEREIERRGGAGSNRAGDD